MVSQAKFDPASLQPGFKDDAVLLGASINVLDGVRAGFHKRQFAFGSLFFITTRFKQESAHALDFWAHVLQGAANVDAQLLGTGF